MQQQAKQQARDAIGQFVARARESDHPRTGLNALRTAVNVRGLAAINRRTAAARALLSWRRELLADLGGEEHCSAAQRRLVEVACRTALFLDHVDAHLMERSSLLDRKRRQLIPLVEQRQRLAESLVRVLSQLGLERRARPVPMLADYVAGRYGKSDVGRNAVGRNDPVGQNDVDPTARQAGDGE